MTCYFTIFSTVFHSYQDIGWMIMTGCVQWNPVYSWKDFCHKRDSNLRLLGQQAYWAIRAPDRENVEVWCWAQTTFQLDRPDHTRLSLLKTFQVLTLKVPNKICSRWHFIFRENKTWFFMWILCQAEDSLETSNLIFSEKQWKCIYECRLLQLWLCFKG